MPCLPIEVEAARENGAVLISVLDRGIGIPEEDREGGGSVFRFTLPAS